MINTALAETLSIALLLAVLVCAAIRPWGISETFVAVPAALLLTLAGAISTHHALDELQQLGPVVIFLSAVLVLAQLCDDEGLFRACGAWMTRAASGRPQQLLLVVFGIASITTVVLSLDATVVLLTPVVFASAATSGARAKPHVYSCLHLSNSASLLLPMSNLTNLLAFVGTGLSFTRFAMLMTLPWLCAIAVEYVVFRRFFASDLALSARIPAASEDAPMPWFAFGTVMATLVGFAVASAFGINLAWVATIGAIVLAVHTLSRRRTTARTVMRSTAVPFLAFVLSLGVVVRAVVDNGLADVLGRVVPGHTTLLALLGIAALAALLANLINNLPAVLVLLPFTVVIGPGAVLAVLLGVNIGPNLTYTGSLATLLWRRTMLKHNEDVSLKEFTGLGLLTVPSALILSVLALWVSLRLVG